MDITEWNYYEAMHDHAVLDHATRPYQNDVVAKAWNGDFVHEGDRIWKLENGGNYANNSNNDNDDIVFDDTDSMNAYIRADIKRLGHDKWAQLVMCEKDATELIISLLNGSLDLVSVFEDYYLGNRVVAEKDEEATL